jgi:hypothetical protein
MGNAPTSAPAPTPSLPFASSPLRDMLFVNGMEVEDVLRHDIPAFDYWIPELIALIAQVTP